jgi:hypothetical protein
VTENEQFGEWIIEKQELEQSLTSETTAKVLHFESKTAGASKKQAEGCKVGH